MAVLTSSSEMPPERAARRQLPRVALLGERSTTRHGMTTTTAARRAVLDQISADIRRCEDLLRRMDREVSWREDALERAGDLAVAGRLAESREMARKAREE